MDITKLKGIDNRKNYDEDSLLSVISRVHSGNTLLFIGAGFSIGAESEVGHPLPLAKELSEKICRLGSFDEDDDLAFSADYFLKYNDSKDLINLLKDSFTVVRVRKYHENIANNNWRRVYTTNYDNTFELASGNCSKPIRAITLEDNPTQLFRCRDICVHINGAIQNLHSDSLENHLNSQSLHIQTLTHFPIHRGLIALRKT